MDKQSVVISSLLVKFNAVMNPENVAARYMTGYSGNEKSEGTVVLLVPDNDCIVNPGSVRIEIPPAAFDLLYQSCLKAQSVLDLTKDGKARIEADYKSREGIFASMPRPGYH